MDALGGGLANVDISKLSDRDKQELQQFAMNEGQKARIQSCTFYAPIDTPIHHDTCANQRTSSDSLSHRHMLPQMHTRGQRQERQAGQVRGAVYEAVCG